MKFMALPKGAFHIRRLADVLPNPCLSGEGLEACRLTTLATENSNGELVHELAYMCPAPTAGKGGSMRRPLDLSWLGFAPRSVLPPLSDNDQDKLQKGWPGAEIDAGVGLATLQDSTQERRPCKMAQRLNMTLAYVKGQFEPLASAGWVDVKESFFGSSLQKFSSLKWTAGI